MRVKVGDRIATTPGGHVAEVTRVDGPNWVVVRFEDSGLETGFKGIDSDYWEKVGWTIRPSQRRASKRKSASRLTTRKRSYGKRTSGPKKGTTRRSGPRRNSVKNMVLAAYVEGFSTPAGIAGYIHKKYDKRVDLDDIVRTMTANL